MAWGTLQGPKRAPRDPPGPPLALPMPQNTIKNNGFSMVSRAARTPLIRSWAPPRTLPATPRYHKERSQGTPRTPSPPPGLLQDPPGLLQAPPGLLQPPRAKHAESTGAKHGRKHGRKHDRKYAGQDPQRHSPCTLVPVVFQYYLGNIAKAVSSGAPAAR